MNRELVHIRSREDNRELAKADEAEDNRQLVRDRDDNRQLVPVHEPEETNADWYDSMEHPIFKSKKKRI